MTRPFVDLVEIMAKAGDGGDGCTSFQSQPYHPRGGPDGGDGGPGGDVILRADPNVSTLMDLNYQKVVEAGDGQDGGPNSRRGAEGEDRVVRVPPGTLVYHAETDEKLGELLEEGETLTVAQGGKGGRGNRCFTNSQRQAPKFHEYGQQGEQVPLRLELKLLAHVGLIGAPNAGKSTLLRSLTRARPEVADHPFTTTAPNLGVLFRDHERMVLCDVPGLIENAHQGAGLGFEFLRHADRTRILLHLVDLSGPHPVQDYRMIRRELRAYDPAFLNKPTLIAVNKMDRSEPGLLELFREEIAPPPGPVISISALHGVGLRTLEENLWHIFRTADTGLKTPSKQETRVVTMEQKQPVAVRKVDDRYILQGDEVEELVHRFDLANPDALSYVRERLLSIGLHRKLESAGCRPGDTVQIGDQLFDYTG